MSTRGRAHASGCRTERRWQGGSSLTPSADQAAIITGLVIAVVSVTYAAYSSADSLRQAVVVYTAAPTAPPGGSTVTVSSAAAGTAPSVTGAAKDAEATPASYADAEAGTAASRASSTSSSADEASAAAAAADEGVEPHPWVFHLTMVAAALYLAMLLTNWGDPKAVNVTNGNPELSVASMWVRMVSQWLVSATFVWTLIAPRCCPHRDFSRAHKP